MHQVASGRVEHTIPFLFSMSGETLDVGVDTGTAVGSYPSDFRFTGRIDHIDVELLPLNDQHHQQVADGEMRGALGTQ